MCYPIVVESSWPITKVHLIVTNKLLIVDPPIGSRLVQWLVHWLHNYNSPSPNVISVNLQPTLHFDDRGGSRHIVQIEGGNTVLRRQLDRRRCQRIDVWPHCVSDPLSFPTRGGRRNGAARHQDGDVGQRSARVRGGGDGVIMKGMYCNGAPHVPECS